MLIPIILSNTMNIVFLFSILFPSVAVGDLLDKDECNRDSGPTGVEGCVLLTPYYSKYQWSTCITDQYMKTYSKGKYACRDTSATYCWYQCMLEIHDKADGPVYDDCTCGPDAPTDGSTQPTVTLPAIPDWCFSPSGSDCTWYRECLEKRYPCKKSGNSYALQYAEKFCYLYEQHYSSFDHIGQLWIDGVRKCLQVSLVPILRPFVKITCEEIKQRAFDSHPLCYLQPGEGLPSYCDIDFLNWARVFWTVKSALIDAPVESLKQLFVIESLCKFRDDYGQYGMMFFKLYIKHTKAHAIIQNTLDEMAANISNTLSETMQWNDKGILHFSYSTKETIRLRKRSTINTTSENAVYKIILIVASSQFDLNAKNSSDANVTAEAIDAAKAIERGDVPLNVGEGITFTELSVCLDDNCTERILQVTPALPKQDGNIILTTAPPNEDGGINVTTAPPNEDGGLNVTTVPPNEDGGINVTTAP